MKNILLSLIFASLIISCSGSGGNKEPVVEPTNELVGTRWERFIVKDPDVNKDVYNYLFFKNATDVEFSSKYNKTELVQQPDILKYTYGTKEVVYRSNGYNYTGTFSGDTLTVVGTAGFLIFTKVP